MDQIIIQSASKNSKLIDSCTVTVSGLLPNTLSFTVTSTTATYVNKNCSLKFIINFADYIDNNSSFIITFPVGSIITYTSITGPLNIINTQISSN
jgi:hypothetical protein